MNFKKNIWIKHLVWDLERLIVNGWIKNDEILAILHTWSWSRNELKPFSDFDFEILTKNENFDSEVIDIVYQDNIPRLLYGYITSQKNIISDVMWSYDLALWYWSLLEDALILKGQDYVNHLKDEIRKVINNEELQLRSAEVELRRVYEYSSKFINAHLVKDIVNITYSVNKILDSFTKLMYILHKKLITSEKEYYLSLVNVKSILDINIFHNYSRLISWNHSELYWDIKNLIMFAKSEFIKLLVKNKSDNDLYETERFNDFNNRILSYLECYSAIDSGNVANTIIRKNLSNVDQSDELNLKKGNILIIEDFLWKNGAEKILKKIELTWRPWKQSFSWEQEEFLWWFYTWFNDSLILKESEAKKYFWLTVEENKIINQYFPEVFPLIRKLINSMTGSDVQQREWFTKFWIQKFPIWKHVSKKWWILHFDLEWTFNGVYESGDISINPKMVDSEIFTLLVMLQPPQEWWETIFQPRKFNSHIYDESQDFWLPSNELTHKPWQAMVFSWFTFHGIKPFSWSTDRITLVCHFRQVWNEIEVWF